MPADDLWVVAAFTLLPVLFAVASAVVIAAVGARRRSPLFSQHPGTEARAHNLLKDWLSPAQLAQYERDREFDVRGSHTGKRYRIRCGRQMNIDELDETGGCTGVLCFGPERHLPVGDVLLAQKLALETDELSALAVANRDRPPIPFLQRTRS